MNNPDSLLKLVDDDKLIALNPMAAGLSCRYKDDDSSNSDQFHHTK